MNILSISKHLINIMLTTRQRLGELQNLCTVAFLIVYATICGTYLCFYRT